MASTVRSADERCCSTAGCRAAALALATGASAGEWARCWRARAATACTAGATASSADGAAGASTASGPGPATPGAATAPATASGAPAAGGRRGGGLRRRSRRGFGRRRTCDHCGDTGPGEPSLAVARRRRTTDHPRHARSRQPGRGAARCLRCAGRHRHPWWRARGHVGRGDGSHRRRWTGRGFRGRSRRKRRRGRPDRRPRRSHLARGTGQQPGGSPVPQPSLQVGRGRHRRSATGGRDALGNRWPRSGHRALDALARDRHGRQSPGAAGVVGDGRRSRLRLRRGRPSARSSPGGSTGSTRSASRTCDRRGRPRRACTPTRSPRCPPG